MENVPPDHLSRSGPGLADAMQTPAVRMAPRTKTERTLLATAGGIILGSIWWQVPVLILAWTKSSGVWPRAAIIVCCLVFGGQLLRGRWVAGAAIGLAVLITIYAYSLSQVWGFLQAVGAPTGRFDVYFRSQLPKLATWVIPWWLVLYVWVRGFLARRRGEALSS